MSRVSLANRTLASNKKLNLNSHSSPIVSKNSHKTWCIIKVQSVIRRWLAINRYKKMILEKQQILLQNNYDGGDGASCSLIKEFEIDSNSNSKTCTINIQSSPLISEEELNKKLSLKEEKEQEEEEEGCISTKIQDFKISSPITTTASISCSNSTSSSSISSIDEYIASLGVKDEDIIGYSSTESESIDDLTKLEMLHQYRQHQQLKQQKLQEKQEQQEKQQQQEQQLNKENEDQILLNSSQEKDVQIKKDEEIEEKEKEKEEEQENEKENEIKNDDDEKEKVIEQEKEQEKEKEKEIEEEIINNNTNNSCNKPPLPPNANINHSNHISNNNQNNQITPPITSRTSSVSSTISMSSSLSSSSLSSSVSDISSNSLSSSINSSMEKSSPLYQRKRTLDEMLRVERGYVQDMTTLIEVFKKPFSEDPLFPENHFFTLFCNIEELKDLHQQFLNDMEKKFEPTNPAKQADLNIGDLFLPFMGSFQKMYELYINNYEKAFALTRYFKINPNFADIQKSIYQKEKDPRCRHLDMNSFLVMPIQRLPRYIVLLKELEKLTPQDNPDFNFIALSLVQLQDLTLFLNESKRKSSNTDKIDDIKQSVFGATAIIGTSKYVMEGQLSLLKGVVASTKKDLFIYLFKECIICTEPNSNYNSNSNSNSSASNSPNNLTPKKQTFKSLSNSTSTPNNLSTSTLSSSISSPSISPNNTLTHSTSTGGANGTPPLSTQLNNSSSSNQQQQYQRIIFKSILFSDVKAISALKNFKDSFQVVTSKKVYTFVAPNTDNRDKWVSAMNDCINSITPPPSPTLSRSSRFTSSLSPTLKRKNRNSVQLTSSSNNTTPQQ